MFDRPEISRHSIYWYPPQYASLQELPEGYPTDHRSSSAFSASANPGEDWTKISDLAERRRIQNRIAQRNYRKKMKKRLEDLHCCAGSSSAVPGQHIVEVSRSHSVAFVHIPSTNYSRPRSQLRHNHTFDAMAQTDVLPSLKGHGTLSQQCTRQRSTPSPPFPYASLSENEVNADYAAYSQPNAYCHMPPTKDIRLYPSYVPSMHPIYANSIVTPIKQGVYEEDDVNPFSMSYASITGVDISATVGPSYQDVTYERNTAVQAAISFARN